MSCVHEFSQLGRNGREWGREREKIWTRELGRDGNEERRDGRMRRERDRRDGRMRRERERLRPRCMREMYWTRNREEMDE